LAARSTPAPTPAKKPLAEYAKKRDFSRTPEPKGKVTADSARAFVVQKHDARRLHFDLRLELDGVLKSWAITRGPSLTVGEKRLAVRTEDHPVEYLDFEGTIPKGEYGGGSMIVWDRGRWTPEGDPRKALTKGHLDFTLEGSRLKGRWHLVRMRPKPGEKTKPWLLIKSEDEFARQPGDPEITDEETTSYLSGRTNAELAKAGDARSDHKGRANESKQRKQPLPDIGKIPGAKKNILLPFVEPSLATLSERAPSGPKWVHEIKHDGYRLQARIDGKKVKLLTRKSLDWTERFDRIAKALGELHLGSALIDGEAIVEDQSGFSSFSNLQIALKENRQDKMRYYAFDLLYLDGYDLTQVPLVERKALLQTALSGVPAKSPIRYSEHLETDGPTMLEHSCRLGLEGIISKRKDSPYRSGRGEAWLKSKCRESQEFVILGYVPSTAATKSVGSLALGYYDNGKIQYAGRVGTGWSTAVAAALWKDLDKLRAKKPAFNKPLPAGAEKDVVWVEPRLVCEIEFSDWTHDDVIRQASFKGLRDDKPPTEIVREARGKRAAGTPSKPKPMGVKLTHPERILWPEEGITKQGLADYYTDIADWILPHLAGRVLSLVRAPSGTGEKYFYAKHPWAGLSDRVKRVDVGESEPMIVVDDVNGLLEMVQAGIVEIHPWGSRYAKLERPDRLIFDLDPGEGVRWSDMIDAARETRDFLAELKLQSFVKTTGGKGLHVVVPVEPTMDWEPAKAFTQSVAETLARKRPDRYVAIMSKRLRRGRVFIDYLRNGRGATAVGAYSTRALPRASVSTPLAWDELSEGLHSDHFTLSNIRARLQHLKDDPWPGFFKIRQRIPKTKP
jgi:bifunctional non-homologous end joining protein LigD